MSTPEKRVLAQDMPQYLQNTEKQRREREKAAQAQYESDLAQYQKDQAEYERQQAEYERQQAEAKQEAENYNKKSEAQQRADELAEKFRNQRLELEARRTKELVEKREILKSQGLSRKQIESALNKIANEYESQINKVKETERIVVGEASFYAENPGKRIDTSVLRSFREGGNLSQLQEKKDLAREAKTQYTKAGQVTTARSEAGKIQSVMASIGTIQGSFGLEGSDRASAIKPTPETTAGKKAVKTRRPLINVDVGQSIMGGQKYSESVKVTTTENRYQIQTDEGVKTFKTMETAQKYADKKQITVPIKPVIREVTRTIPETPESRGVSPKTNPLAFITGLSRQEVSSSSGLPAEQKTIFSFQNILDVKEESGRALLEFQSQLKTRTAPSATVYKGILEERGLPVTPLSKRIIDTFSSKGIFRDYKEPVAAKGKKGIVSKDGEKIFDIGTGMGDVTIGRKFGFVYDYNLQRPTTDQPKLFEGTLQYVLSPKVQGPPKPKYEDVVAVPGSLEYAVQSQPTSFNKLVESSYKSVDEFQSSLQKNYPLISAVGPSQALELIKIGITTGGLITSGTEQYIDPFVQEKLGLKRTARPTPLILGKTSEEVLLPVDIGKSFESNAIVPKEKYFEGIYEYGKKYGAGSLIVGGYTYYLGKGVLQVPRKGLEIVGIVGQRQKLLLRGEEKLQTVYSGITFRNRPVLGIQEGRLRFGIDYSKIPYERIDIENPVYARSGMEAALGSGIEKFIFYSRPALEVQKRKGVISELSQKRAEEVTKGTEMGMKAESKVGSFASVPFENLSKRQSDYLFKTTTSLQKKKRVEAVHGSVALGAQVPKEIQSAIKFGDIDIVPTKPTPPEANKLLDIIAKDFPLEKGQRIQTVKPSSPTSNRQILLFTEGKKEPEKILEVVLKGDEKLPSGESIVTKGTNILGFKIPFGKSVKEKSFGLKVHTANYQLLTNVKQAISYQKGKGGELLDIYPSSGRVKDVARTYLNLKAKAIFKGGQKGKELDIQAEKIKSLYNIDFGDIGTEKIILSSYTPKTTSITNKFAPRMIPTATVKREPVETRESNIQSKIRESKASITPSVQYPRSVISRIIPSRIQPSSRVSSLRSKTSVTPSRIQSAKPSQTPSNKPRSVITPSKTPTYRIQPKIITPPSRMTRTPPSVAIPPTSFESLPPSRITILSPSRITPRPPSYRLSPPPNTTTTIPPPNRKLPILLDMKEKIPKSVLQKQKERADFLGASSELQISGVFKRAEITYGQKKISRLLKGDVRVVSGKTRNTKRGPIKWTEGKKGDMFGFKNEAKKKRKTSIW